MMQIKHNDLNGVVMALDQKVASDMEIALNYYDGCSTDQLAGVMEEDLDGGYDHRLTTNVPANAVIYHTRDVCQVVAMTKYKVDAQHIACAMNLYFCFADHGTLWFENDESGPHGGRRPDLLVHDAVVHIN